MYASLSCPPNTGTVSKGLSSSSEIRSLVSAIERGKSSFFGNCAFEDECTSRPLEGAFTTYNQHVWADVNPYAKLISFSINIFCKNNLGPPSRILSSANALMKKKTFHVALTQVLPVMLTAVPHSSGGWSSSNMEHLPIMYESIMRSYLNITFPNR